MKYNQPEANFQAFLRRNRSYIIFFSIFWIPLAISLLFITLGDVILWTNARRTDFGDVLFTYSTKLGEGFGYLFVIIVLLFYRYRSAITVPFLGLAVFLTSVITKRVFAQARPIAHFKFSGEFELLKPLEGIFLSEGWNSFPSGHTMSGFALYGFLAFCLPRKRFIGPMALLLAAMVGLSRIYLLQHFLRDVVVGAVFGLLIAMVVYFVHFKIWPAPHPWLDRHLGDGKGKV